jgi:hypothetical protein
MKSKAAFVRSLPRSLSAKEVVAKAKAAGVKLSPAYVYVLRSKAGSAGTTKAKGGRKARATNGNTEEQFVTLALDVGLGRASELLTAVRNAARAAAQA